MADYSFQKECLNEIEKNKAGIIILPTGAGKTRIEATHATNKMIRDDGKHQIVIVLAPRIILCQQLIKDFYEFLNNKYNGDIQEVFTFVSSNRFPSITINGEKMNGVCTTDKKQVAHDIKLANKAGRDSVIISTYASFYAAVKGVQLVTKELENTEVHLIADEAHFFTRGRGEIEENLIGNSRPFDVLKANLSTFKTRFFFTATPKVRTEECSEPGTEMNNEAVYGKVVYLKKPKDLISKGIICTPLVHAISNFKTKSGKEITEQNFDNYAGDFILKAFIEHEKRINDVCADKDIQLGAKIIVATKGSKQLLTLIKNGFVQRARGMGIEVAWTMSSEKVGTYVNSVERDIDDFLVDIKKISYDDLGNVKNEKRMIILHYDQLTEGIDVPAMSGLLVLRPMTKDKMVQNIGRVMRVHNDDRKKDYADLDSWIKPYSYIMVPRIGDIGSSFNDIVQHLRDDYDPNVAITDINMAEGTESDQIDLQNQEHTASKYRFLHDDVIHEIEEHATFKQNVSAQILAGGEVDFTVGMGRKKMKYYFDYKNENGKFAVYSHQGSYSHRTGEWETEDEAKYDVDTMNKCLDEDGMIDITRLFDEE